MNLFYFDIETVPQYENLDSFQNNDPIGYDIFQKRYFKMKWDEKYQSMDLAYIEQGGLSSLFGKICCISFGFINDKGEIILKSFYGEDEKKIVSSFNDTLLKIETRDFKLSGFYINIFDIPFILHKIHKYGIIPSELITLHNKKPWEYRIVDIAEDWKLKSNIFPSMEEICYELGIKCKTTLKASDVRECFYKGDYEIIKRYCEEDIVSTINISKKIYKF